MKKIILCFFLMVSSVSAAQAALRPDVQRIIELRAILSLDELYEIFTPYHLIERVEYVDPDVYRITAGSCQVDAIIKDEPNPQPMPGPRKFYVALENLNCPSQ